MRKLTNTVLLIGLFASVISSGCSKDKKEAVKNCRIITVSQPGTIFYNLLYTADNKLSSASSGTSVTRFTYNGNIIVATTLLNGVTNKKETITLNANGLAANVKREPGFSGEAWSNLLFEYNGQQVIKRTLTSSAAGQPEVLLYSWANGNLASIAINGLRYADYDYYTDKENQTGELNTLAQFVEGYEVVRNKNIRKLTKYSNGQTESCNYEFDSEGKIAAAHSALAGSTKNFTFQYQCN